MIRDFEIHEGKIAPAYAAAASDVATGMGVVLDRANKTFALPKAATAENIHVVHKARRPVGLSAAQTDFSDYFEEFNTVKAGERVPLKVYEADDVFGTDQFDDSISASDVGSFMAVGTDGKWAIAGSGAASVYRLVDLYVDAGNHTLARIEVLANAGENA